jgi:hypothetical protein
MPPVLLQIHDRIWNRKPATYTAIFRTDQGDTITVVKQPPQAAFVGSSGRFIVATDHVYACTAQAAPTCRRARHSNGSFVITVGNDNLVTDAIGPDFFSADLSPFAIANLEYLSGNYTITQSDRTLAGLPSLCAAAVRKPGTDTNLPTGWTLCVAASGLITSGRIPLPRGSNQGESFATFELTTFTTTTDPSQFQLPTNATVVDIATESQVVGTAADR